jgi:PqqD family protein of HPr-rel-A system
MVQAEDIIWRRIGDEVVVIKDDGLATHVLNKTAALIWELCDGKRGIDEIAAVLCERYDVSPEEARADTKETIEDLTKVGIIKYI